MNAETMTKSNVLLTIHNQLHLQSNYYDIKVNHVQNAVMMLMMHLFKRLAKLDQMV